MKRIILLVVFIICIASFFRLWHLSGVPISPNWDEAALGYNAYSILKTGRDEYGVRYPFVLRSFNNYTPALYSYLAIPSIFFFDLSVFSTRLPSAVMGILAVIGTFFLTIELLSLHYKLVKRNIYISLVTTFLLAVSPWHVQFSRVAYEGNIALTLCIFGFLFFLWGLKKPIWFIGSAIWYGFSLNAYHSTRLFVPLFVLGLCILFRKQIFEKKKHLVIPIIVGFLFIIPFLYFFSQKQSNQILARFSATSIFSTPSSQSTHFIFNSNVENTIYEILTGYLSHFSPKWLFITGDNDRHHAPSMGIMYIWEAPFLLLGLFTILLSKGIFRSVFLLWFLLVPIPASLTSEVPHAVRTLIFLPSFQIATALGLEKGYVWIKRFSFPKQALIVFAFMTIIIFSILQYAHLYFYQMNHEVSRAWQFGYEHVINYVQQNRGKYKKVIVSNNLEEPYIFFLFYLRYDPKKYLFSDGGTKNTPEQKFDKYEFRHVKWGAEKHDGSVLYVLAPDEVPTQEIHTIRYFDSNKAFVFAE